MLVPILDHVKYLGKHVSKQSVSYFSEEDEMDVYVGIEGVNIRTDATISLDEMLVNGKYRLTLNIKTP